MSSVDDTNVPVVTKRKRNKTKASFVDGVHSKGMPKPNAAAFLANSSWFKENSKKNQALNLLRFVMGKQFHFWKKVSKLRFDGKNLNGKIKLSLLLVNISIVNQVIQTFKWKLKFKNGYIWVCFWLLSIRLILLMFWLNICKYDISTGKNLYLHPFKWQAEIQPLDATADNSFLCFTEKRSIQQPIFTVYNKVLASTSYPSLVISFW